MNAVRTKRLGIFAVVGALLLSVILSVSFKAEKQEESAVGAPILFERVFAPEVGFPELGDAGVEVASSKSTVFTDVYYGETLQTAPASVGVDIEKFFYSNFRVSFFSEKYTPTSNKTNVVIYGRTDIPVTAELADAVDARPADSRVWGMAYRDGVFALYANSKVALDEQNDLFVDLYAAMAHYITDGKLVLPDGLFIVYEVTASEYQALLDQKVQDDIIKAEQEKQERLEAMKEALANGFTNADFDPDNLGITEDMEEESGRSYIEPEVFPPRGEHPRVLFTAADIPGIIESLAKEENKEYYDKLMDLVNTQVDGILPPAKEVTTGRRGIHNYDLSILGVIQAKAFYYVITGDEYSGYEAVYSIMNYIKTLDIKYIYSDQTREFGYVMYIAACVYDWCYDLISEENKLRISLGIEHLICRGKVEMASSAAAGGVKMEVGFPPTSQGPVTGHGSERQLLRDYLSYSIAVFDELPNWYEFIAGRIYEQFIPVREVFYEAGMYPQGTITYVSGRFFSDMSCAALIYGFAKESPFSENQKDVVVSWAAHITEGRRYFPTGDGTSTGASNVSGLLGCTAFMAAYLYNDALCYNIATNMDLGFYNKGGALTGISVTEMLIMNVDSYKFEVYENTKEEIPTIVYNGGYLGQYITRNNWSDEAAITFVKANVRTTANHDHDDSGTFQIYYKELLTGDTGVYGSYGTEHWTYYHQATVSHNGILIVNPSKVSGYYSGSQVGNTSEAGLLDSWLSTTYERATVVGNAHGYDQNGVAKFSYLKSDISKSYGSDQASYVARTTLTAYTENEDFPMVFFVLDRIDAVNDNRVKKFLLQLPGAEEPVIDEEKGTVTVTRGEGKLVLTSLIGGDKIEGIGGGVGKNFMINGTQCAASDEESTSWGRVEISTTGNLSDVLLNVMYVTDSTNEKSLTPVRVSGVNNDGATVMEGATVAGITALFATDIDANTAAVSFTSEGEGTMTYYVGGLFEGTWRVLIDGAYTGTVYSTHEGGMVSFKAPAGADIKLEPGADIQPDGSEKITYILDGGVLDKKADAFYFPGTALTLTTNVTRGSDTFAGWYLDADRKEKIEVIPETMTGRVVLYAKWNSVFANEDYSETVLNHVDKTTSAGANGINYNSSDGATVTYKTEKRAGDGYLYFEVDRDGPSIFVKNTQSNISTMSESKITYIFEIASSGTGNDMDILFRARTPKINGSYAQELNIISVKDGVIHFGYFSGPEVAEIGADFVKVAVVYDFEAGTKTLYSPALGEGNTISEAFDPSKKALFTEEILSARAWGAGAIKIGAIQIFEGDRSADAYKSNLPENRIEYPAEAILPDDINIGYTPGSSNAIPTEGIYALSNGKYMRPDGWYSDAACTNKITEIPASATGAYKVYTKWVEDDYIYYPEETGLEPKKYTPGEALPTDIKNTIGGIEVSLIGWYLNSSFSGEAITAIPENASGAVTLYAKWETPNVISYPTSVKLPAGYDLSYVAGVTKLIAKPEYNGKEKVVFGGWFTDPQFKNPVINGIVPEGTEGVFVVYANWITTVFEMDPEATDLNKDNIGNSGFSVKDGGLGTYATVENGDEDYIHVYMPDDEGWTITAGAPNVCDAIKGDMPKVITFTMKVGAFDVANTANVTIRMRIGGTNPQTMITISNVDGKVQIKGRGDHVLAEFDSGFVEVTFVVDFDNKQIRYYVDGEHAVTWNGWSYAFDGTTTFAQFRFNTAGSLDLAYFKISLGDETVVNSNLPENRVKFPENTVLPEDFNIEYNSDGSTVLPTEGVYAIIDGKYMIPDGWYSDVACKNKITAIPAGTEGVFQIFTNWVEADYIYYPEESGLAPEKYLPGQALPIDIMNNIGGIDVPLDGWYLDPSFAGDPITKIPDDASGAVVLYAKWAEPNIIEYPSSVKVPEGTDLEYVAGVTALLKNPEYYDSSKNVEFRGWYLDEALTQPITDGIVPAGSEGVFRVYARWITVVFEMDAEATESNTNNLDGTGFYKKDDGNLGTYGTVENGDDDYLYVYMPDDSGRTITASAPNVKDCFEDDDDKIVSYTMRVGAGDAANTANISIRMRIGGSNPQTMITILENDGKVQIKGRGDNVLLEFDEGFVDIGFVVDFEKNQIRYYINGEHALTWGGWSYDFEGTTTFAQFRFNSEGSLQLAYFKIALGDEYAD